LKNQSVKNRDIAGTFRQLFEIAPALDAASIEMVYRIRHEVYCRELGWEAIRESGLESDEFDRHSIHCLLRKRDTGEAIGCTRLILTRPENPGYPLPFEESCAAVLDRSVVDPAKLPRSTIGEVSRLAVLSYRHRKGETASPISVRDQDFGRRGGVPRFPFAPVSLYLGAAAIARRLGVEHVFVLTEPRLASHFVRIGFDIRSIGGPIEHRGTRVPSLLSSSKVVQGLRPMIKPLYAVIEEAVEQAFLGHPVSQDHLPVSES
jgi:N-acyl amino acid synthase of PEP-CTERM/exosortase system